MSAAVLVRKGANIQATTQLTVCRRLLPPSTSAFPSSARYQLLPPRATSRPLSTSRKQQSPRNDAPVSKTSRSPPSASSKQQPRSLMHEQTLEWEDKGVDYRGISGFTDLPYRELGYNQHMLINDEFKRALSDIVRTFHAPVIYAFAYGSGVFPQTKNSGRTPTEEQIHAVHPKPDPAIVASQGDKPKMIDFIFGVSHTQHFHSLNIRQNRDHYSALASFGSGLVSTVQDRYGAGVYFNPYVVVNGVLIKYGVVNIDTLCKDLTEWDTLYLAGRLHKPVKIIRDNARVRLANQTNLLAAVRTALLMLPEAFTERELYATIAGLSYLGDPRMALPAENPQKVANIVGNNTAHFRRLYAPLVQVLPNVDYDLSDLSRAGPDEDLVMRQNMADMTRGNMVRRLPKAFRSRLYFKYQKKWQMSREDFARGTENLRTEEGGVAAAGRQGGEFDRAIARDDDAQRTDIMRAVIKQTIGWPSTAQALKGVPMSGIRRSVRYLGEKMAKYREGKQAAAAEKSDLIEDEEKKGLLREESSSSSGSGDAETRGGGGAEEKTDDSSSAPSPPEGKGSKK